MITWVLERVVFGDQHELLGAAAREAGHGVIDWDDDWWRTGLPSIDGTVVFHGSLGNAARLAESLWVPGAFCRTQAFACSSWYEGAVRYTVQRSWQILPANELVADPGGLRIDHDGRVFVRPDSPLKPFSGRVVTLEGLALADLDHGFYFDDETLPVVVAPVVSVEAEWRVVVVGGAVVAGSGYEADGREGTGPLRAGSPPWAYAQQVAAQIVAPEVVYVMDLCLSGGQLRLIELNPFSGADLYECDRRCIVDAVATLLGTLPQRHRRRGTPGS